MSTDLNDDGSVDADDLEQAILSDAIEGIASVSSDGVSVTAQSLSDRLKVVERLSIAESTSQPHFGLRFTKLLPPGGGG